MIKREWKIQYNDWNKIPLGTAQFILVQGEKRLCQTVDKSTRITSVSQNILFVLVAGVSSLVAFLFRELNIKGTEWSPIVIFLTLIILITLAAIIYLSRNVFPRSSMPLGRSPKEIATKDMFESSFEERESLLIFILNEIEDCQSKIDFNEEQNNERLKRLKIAIVALAVMFISATAVSLMLLFLYSPSTVA